MLKTISEIIDGAVHRTAIAGHVNPDGDCVGSCTALYLYLKKNYPEMNPVLFLERPKDSLLFMKDADEIRFKFEGDEQFDVFISCDVSDTARIGLVEELFGRAERTICIDHHATNPGFAQVNHVVPEASSCAEVLADLMDKSLMDINIAEALYTGIIHDTGVFQYSNASGHTLRVAADLLDFGFDAGRIIDETFNQRSFDANRMMGYVVSRSELFADGKGIVGTVTLKEQQEFSVDKKDLDIIVSVLRETKGVEAAVFIYETAPGVFKGSLRSNTVCNVAETASKFGGGGHVKAAGCTLEGTLEEVKAKLVGAFETELRKL